jgi:hypothetical protein
LLAFSACLGGDINSNFSRWHQSYCHVPAAACSCGFRNEYADVCVWLCI